MKFENVEVIVVMRNSNLFLGIDDIDLFIFNDFVVVYVERIVL